MHWRKLENAQGIPFYINESTNVQQWDHPKFADIKQGLDDCNYVKYSSYRVALKFRILQQMLYMDQVPLTIVSGVFERHRLGNNESSLCLESCDLEAVLSDIYYASNKLNHTNTDIDLASELLINLFFNIFDMDRNGKIQVSSTKILLGILSNCTFLEFNKFLFMLCADHNNCVTRLKLQNFLTKITTIIKFMHEDSNFGQHLVNHSVENCFSNSPGLVGVNESTFINWLEETPQILTWLPLLYRIKTAENVVHTDRCTHCKISPIIGLKYNCIKCSKYIQCQRCFFTGKTNGSHKLSHSMREYSKEENSRESSSNFFKKFIELFPCSNKTNCNNEISIVSKNFESDKTFDLSTENLCNTPPLSSPQNQLQNIIKHLEFQNRQLEQIFLGRFNERDLKKIIEEHRLHLRLQIQKLRLLMDNINTISGKSMKVSSDYGFESTPIKYNTNYNGTKSFQNEPLSSIRVQKCSKRNCNNKSQFKNSYDLEMNSCNTAEPQGKYYDSEKNQRVKVNEKAVPEIHNDLDDALAKLQQILANNFSLDESLGNIDNGQLKYAFSEVEGMLANFVDTVESSRGSTRANSSAQLFPPQK